MRKPNQNKRWLSFVRILSRDRLPWKATSLATVSFLIFVMQLAVVSQMPAAVSPDHV